MVETVGLCDGMALGVKIAGEYVRCLTFCECCEQDADGALADDEDGFVRLQVEEFDGLVTGVDWFDPCGLFERDVVRYVN